MTTLQPSMNWHPDQAGARRYQQTIHFNRTEEKRVRAKSINLEGWEVNKQSDISEKLSLFCIIIEDVFNEAIRVGQLIKNSSGKKEKSLSDFDPKTFLASKIDGLSAIISPESEVAGPANDVFKVAQQYIEDRSSSGNQAIIVNGKQTRSNHFMFNPRGSDRERKSWLEHKQLDAYNYICQNLNEKYLEVSFSEEEKQFLGSEGQKIDPEKMSCFGYTFLKLREIEAKHLIINPLTSDLKVAKLVSWGYYNVTDPIENDLILYIGNEIIHVGRFTGGGAVESKWGVNGKVYHHSVFDVPETYGTKVVFMRKAPPVISD